jgi:hypothetical protein
MKERGSPMLSAPGVRVLVLLAALALCPVLAAAQAVANSDEISLYAGHVLAQELTHRPLSGTYPRLPDQLIYGARYNHWFTREWGGELALQQTPAKSTAQPANAQMRIRSADFDVTWNFTPDSQVVGYTLMGLGYARNHLDVPVTGIMDGSPVSLAARSTVTVNVGMGARAYLTRHLLLRAELRYRYLGHMVEPAGRGVSTFETMAGAGWRF